MFHIPIKAKGNLFNIEVLLPKWQGGASWWFAVSSLPKIAYFPQCGACNTFFRGRRITLKPVSVFFHSAERVVSRGWDTTPWKRCKLQGKVLHRATCSIYSLSKILVWPERTENNGFWTLDVDRDHYLNLCQVPSIQNLGLEHFYAAFGLGCSQPPHILYIPKYANEIWCLFAPGRSLSSFVPRAMHTTERRCPWHLAPHITGQHSRVHRRHHSSSPHGSVEARANIGDSCPGSDRFWCEHPHGTNVDKKRRREDSGALTTVGCLLLERFPSLCEWQLDLDIDWWFIGCGCPRACAVGSWRRWTEGWERSEFLRFRGWWGWWLLCLGWGVSFVCGVFVCVCFCAQAAVLQTKRFVIYVPLLAWNASLVLSMRSAIRRRKICGWHLQRP